MRRHRIVAIIFGLLLAAGAAPAQAQVCIIPHGQEVFCSGTDGCTGQATRYTCYGYGTPQSTCGGSCVGTITCCGNSIGPSLVTCGQQCAGCQPDKSDKPQVAEVTNIKDVKPKKVGLSKTVSAASHQKPTTNSVVGTGAGGHR